MTTVGTRDLRRLMIRVFHVNKAGFSGKGNFKKGFLELPEKPEITESLIKSADIELIHPGDHDRYVDTIMDIIPISAKVLGRLGEGVTHTFTGIYVMLTGVDEDGRQMHEFGSSEGNLKEQLKLGKCGTPSVEDLIIHIKVVLKGGQPYERILPESAFAYTDRYISLLRDVLKELDARDADETHEYYDKIREGKDKVVIVKQVAGQGAMYDTMLFSNEPSGTDGISIIDMKCMPAILSPNEYRDGAIRAMS